jgi:hypothetical protein
VLNKNEELDFFEILKNNFPDLKQQGLVVGLDEFLAQDLILENYICKSMTVKESALKYIHAQKPYIVLDETEGYKCLFFRGNFVKIQYDATNSKIIRYAEETD